MAPLTITEAERQSIAALLLEGKQLLDAIDEIERRIVSTLGLAPGEAVAQADAITDAVAGVLPLEALLRACHVAVES